MAAGKSDKEEFFAAKIEEILGNDAVADVRISSHDGERIVGVKFEGSVEVRIHYDDSHSFSFLELSNSGPGKVLAQAPRFKRGGENAEVLAFCYNLLEAESGEKFLSQVGRYFRAFDDDRIDFT